MGFELSPAAARILQGLVAGKSLDELAPADDPARADVVRMLKRLLPRERTPKSTSGPAPSAAGPPPSASRSTAPLMILRSDGASRGNPGPASVGVVFEDLDGTVVHSFGRTIGPATNNVAEYCAVLAGLEAAKELGLDNLELRLDSELVVRQLNGQYKVKHPALIDLKEDVDRLLAGFRNVRILHVPREENREADKLANRALDGK